MNSHLMAYFVSAGAVALAEMADKTQLMTIAFAAKYKVSKVAIGVFLAILLNQSLAVILGNVIGQNQNISIWLQVVASISFIFFGLWGLRGSKSEEVEAKKTKYGAIITVAIAFFIAELGDKTQLATIAFAVTYPESPLWILLGTITGMLIANLIGIIIGCYLCKNIPEEKIKILSATVFILFGFIGLYQVMSNKLNMDISSIIVILVLIAAITGLTLYYIMKNRTVSKKTNISKYCKVKGR